jgi:hypothetical protein
MQSTIAAGVGILIAIVLQATGDDVPCWVSVVWA